MIRVETLTGDAMAAHLDRLADLRIAVFRDWPYLYDGDRAHEAQYLRSYADAPDAVMAAAWQDGDLVGMATGMPLTRHGDAAQIDTAAIGVPVDDVFYCAESVLLPVGRGQGVGHRFFDLREAHAGRLGMGHSAFCAVTRPDDHPMRPDAPRDLHPFWRKRGYAPVPGLRARFGWRDVGDTAETDKDLQLWMRRL